MVETEDMEQMVSNRKQGDTTENCPVLHVKILNCYVHVTASDTSE